MSSVEKMSPAEILDSVLSRIAESTGEGLDEVAARYALTEPTRRTRVYAFIGLSVCDDGIDIESVSRSVVRYLLLNHIDVTSYITARTQKARGVSWLANMTTSLDVVGIAQDPFVLAELVCRVAPNGFVRPCPIVPRHGFVESRRVQSLNTQEALDLWKEVREADPQGEILVTRYIDSICNIVLTPTLAAIGPENDGATAGRDCLELPIAYVYSDPRIPSSLIPPDEVAYFEAVLGRYDQAARLTQLRSGPKQQTGQGNIIHTEMTVLRVIWAEGEGLAWEKQMADAQPGDVVYHPGGSRLSHYAVHAYINKIPILFDREPVVGEVLQPTGDLPAATSWDRSEVMRGMYCAFDMPLFGKELAVATEVSRQSRAVHVMLYTLHHMIALLSYDSKMASFLLGYSVMALWRLGTAACVGESRHVLHLRRTSRDDVYARMLRKRGEEQDRTELAEEFHKAEFCFGYVNWPSNQFGGLAWYRCAQACSSLEDAISFYMLGEMNETSLVDALNSTISVAHNNGWWLNKFADQSLFARSVKGQPDTLSTLLSSVWVLLRVLDTPNGVDFESKVTSWFLDVRPHTKVAPYTLDQNGNRHAIQKEFWGWLSSLDVSALPAPRNGAGREVEWALSAGCSCARCMKYMFDLTSIDHDVRNTKPASPFVSHYPQVHAIEGSPTFSGGYEESSNYDDDDSDDGDGPPDEDDGIPKLDVPKKLVALVHGATQEYAIEVARKHGLVIYTGYSCTCNCSQCIDLTVKINELLEIEAVALQQQAAEELKKFAKGVKKAKVKKTAKAKAVESTPKVPAYQSIAPPASKKTFFSTFAKYKNKS